MQSYKIHLPYSGRDVSLEIMVYREDGQIMLSFEDASDEPPFMVSILVGDDKCSLLQDFLRTALQMISSAEHYDIMKRNELDAARMKEPKSV